MSKKKLEIRHYATFEEMEADKRRSAMERNPTQRFDDLMALIGLSFMLHPADKAPSSKDLIILPQRSKHGHL